jgi:FeS assembly protein IscX
MIEEMLTWDDTFTIAHVLRERYPKVKLEDVSLGMIFHWTITLPEFNDDPVLANDSILTEIYQEWFEEVNPV